MPCSFPHLFIAVAAWFLLGAVPCCAFAEEAFTIVFEDYPPYEYMEDDEAKGINIAIIREAFRRMKVKPVFRTMPWKRGLYELKAGNIAALASGFKTPAREAFAIFPRHYLSLEVNAIFVHKDSPLRVYALEDLRGKIVGVVREYTYGPEFDAAKRVMKLDPVNSNPLLVGKLLERRVDAIAGNLRVIEALAARVEARDSIKPVFLLSSEPLYLFFSKVLGKGMGDLARLFDAAMDSMEADGALARLRNAN